MKPILQLYALTLEKLEGYRKGSVYFEDVKKRLVKEKEGDMSFENNGVKVVVDKKSYLYLVGTTLDFSGGLNGKGFVFQNPNADRTCGCGESFSV
jgi:iron-sulfur cluster assembly accessory protein